MSASDNLSAVQFRTDKTDMEQARKAGERDGEEVAIYDPSNLREDQYERLGRKDVEVNPKREAKKMRIV